jgi:hypothetical protein
MPKKRALTACTKYVYKKARKAMHSDALQCVMSLPSLEFLWRAGNCRSAFTPSTGVQIPLGTPNLGTIQCAKVS